MKLIFKRDAHDRNMWHAYKETTDRKAYFLPRPSFTHLFPVYEDVLEMLCPDFDPSDWDVDELEAVITVSMEVPA